MKGLKFVLSILLAGLVLQPPALWACAACYGQSDSPLARGLNWGIFSLLAVIVGVLGGVASFFVYLGKRSAKTADDGAAGAEAERTRKV